MSDTATLHDWRTNKEAYDQRATVDAIRLQRELLRNPAGIFEQELTDQQAQDLIPKLDKLDARYIAYPSQWSDGEISWTLFSNQPDQGQLVEQKYHDQLFELVWEAVNTPRGRKALDCGDWGYSDALIAADEIRDMQAAFPIGDDLAKELFGTLGVATGDAGAGDWPKPPKRTITDQGRRTRLKGSAITFTHSQKTNSITGQIAPRWERKWQIDQREYYYRVRRAVQQVHCEMSAQTMYWRQGLTEDEITTLANRWKAREERVARIFYPYHEGKDEAGEIHFAAISNQQDNGFTRVPRDRAAAMELFDPWLWTPEGMRTRPAPHYGGVYQGNKGDGRKAAAKQIEDAGMSVPDELIAIQFVTKRDPVDVAAMLNETLNERLYGAFNVGDPWAFYGKLSAECDDLQVRGGKDAWLEFVEFIANTQLRYTPESEEGIPNQGNEREKQHSSAARVGDPDEKVLSEIADNTVFQAVFNDRWR